MLKNLKSPTAPYYPINKKAAHALMRTPLLFGRFRSIYFFTIVSDIEPLMLTM